MEFKITYDKKARIRARYGPYAFDNYICLGLYDYLKSFDFIKDVKISKSNGSILLYYDKEKKDQVLDILKSITRKKLREISYEIDNELEKLNKKFKSRIVKLIAARILYPVIFPMYIGKIITVLRSYSFIKKGIKSLLSARITVDVLDMTSISASILANDFKTANSIMFLLNLSSVLEDYTMRSANYQLAKSLEINTDYIWALENEKEVKKPLSSIKLGDLIVSRTGAMIPVDGTVISGEAMINESSMTGESMPVRKYENSTVYAGSVNEDGKIILRVDAVDSSTRISKIIDLIDKSKDLKSNAQSRAQSLADNIVPFSLLTFAGVYLFTGNITRAMSVLMVDYSCAIKLSTPICVICAMKEASVNNILVKGGKYLEAFKDADTIVFDKTGTLTNATPSLAKIVPFYDYTKDEVLKIAACLEEHFPHSVARAIVKAASDKNIIHEEDHAEVEYIVAHGISSKLNGERALIGSRHFIEDDENIYLSESQKEIYEKECLSYSNLFLALGDKIIAVFCIEDPPRAEAFDVVYSLRKKGFNDISMITGDTETAARMISDRLKLDSYVSQVLPDEKYNIIEDLKSKGKTVIMVGDGINDSPALSSANVSVSMKDSSDIAREVSDITLLSNSLYDLLNLRIMSQRLFERIQTNYEIIIGFNTSLILFGLSGFLMPSTSAFLHNLSTLLICLYSSRPLLGEDKYKNR